MSALLVDGVAAAAVVRPHQDVNGDGLADVALLGAPTRSAQGPYDAVVVLGAAASGPVDRAVPGARGIRLYGDAPLDDVSVAGDLDGDGFAELLVERTLAADLVLRGRADVRAIDLDVAGPDRVRIRGTRSLVASGGGVGDVTGDHVDDLVVADRRDRPVLLKGMPDFGPIDLARPLGARGWRIAHRPRSLARPSFAGPAGDPNGDGIGDLLVAFDLDVYCGEVEACGAQAFVLFGGAQSGDVTITGGWRRRFAARRAAASAGYDAGSFGYGGDAIGDWDGDGRDDQAFVGYDTPAGIVFGKSGTGPVAGVFRRGDASAQLLGAGFFPDGLAGMGDLDGDARGDLAVPDDTGGARVLLSPGGRADLDVMRPPRGYRIAAPRRREVTEVRATGDVNGDGLGDMLLITGRYGVPTPRWPDWIVYGKADTTAQRLTGLAAGGFPVR